MGDCFWVGFLVGAHRKGCEFFLCRGASLICVFCASIIKHGVLTDDILIPKKERQKNTSDTLTV